MPGFARDQPGPCAWQTSTQSAIGRTPPPNSLAPLRAPLRVTPLVWIRWCPVPGLSPLGGRGNLAAVSGDAGRASRGRRLWAPELPSGPLGAPPRDSHFMEETETSSSLNCLDPGTGPRGAWRCSWTSAAPSLRPRTSALGQERPEAHSRGLRQPLPKSVLSLAFSFLPVPRD